jgi:hypothetical protein
VTAFIVDQLGIHLTGQKAQTYWSFHWYALEFNFTSRSKTIAYKGTQQPETKKNNCPNHIFSGCLSLVTGGHSSEMTLFGQAFEISQWTRTVD